MIINTFISDGGEVPEYTNVCLRQARKTNPDEDIRFICKDDQQIFKELNIQWVPQDSVSSELLDEFNRVCWFKRHGTPNTSYPSPELFWHRTAERIYYLQAYINQHDLENVFHFENDVLIYYGLDLVPTRDAMMVLPMSINKATFAFAHIPNKSHINSLCGYFNWLLYKHGEKFLANQLNDHVSEMSLLHIALQNGLVSALPILPSDNDKMVFDPASYGQFLSGTNNGHGAGFTDPEHFIGREIQRNNLNIIFYGKPFVNDTKIFNLHIHSKNLKEFASV